MSVQEIRSYLDTWRDGGDPAAVAVLTEAWSSAPRRPGARFVRSESGAIGGNVSAGCVEADLALRLDAILAGGPSEVVSYGVSDDTAIGVGLSCGGRIELFLEAWSPQSPVWPTLYERLDARSPVILVSLISGSASGHWLLDPSGKILAADVPDALPSGSWEEGLTLLPTGGASVLRTADSPTVLVETFLAPRRLIVVGGTPVGVALARLARSTEIPVCIVEPRTAYGVNLESLDIEVLREWPEEAFDRIRLDASCAVAVVAHDDRLDVPALTQALGAECGYVGLLGGRRTREARVASLLEAGVSKGAVEGIRAPIGLDIGADRPAEIAVSILAEVIGVWRNV
jgi:xanthine dehydrogenase accessory factor